MFLFSETEREEGSEREEVLRGQDLRVWRLTLRKRKPRNFNIRVILRFFIKSFRVCIEANDNAFRVLTGESSLYYYIYIHDLRVFGTYY